MPTIHPSPWLAKENLEEFLAGLQDFVESRKEEGRQDEITLRDYLQEVSLLTDLDSDGNGEERRKVTLMTVHSAKGLEFPTVFVVGLRREYLPFPHEYQFQARTSKKSAACSTWPSRAPKSIAISLMPRAVGAMDTWSSVRPAVSSAILIPP